MFVRFLMLLAIALLFWSAYARSSEGGGPRQYYVVKPYDTLWSIAVAHYGGDPREAVWKLQDRNHLAGAVVTPGERLVLP
jgi:LysM repeat protein